MTPNEKEIRQRLKNDFIHYAEKALTIRTKSGDLLPFTLNKAQIYIHSRLEQQKALTGKVRALILKGRQQGCSTLIGGRFYHQTTHRYGVQAFILAHKLEATQNLYKMANRFYENTPALIKPVSSTSNAKELVFGVLDSGYKLGTSENKDVGRSATIQLLHGSEVAFWNHTADHAKGIMQAVPNEDDTEIILESTANGVGNYFHQKWQSAEAGLSEYIAIFVPWFWQDEYRAEAPIDFSITPEEQELKELYGLNNEQLYWRRIKIDELSVNGEDGEKSFKQEYPCNPEEAFQLTGSNSYINSQVVMKARKGIAEPYGKKLLGVDPARFGDDRTSIIRRQGRVAYGLKSYTKKDTMEVTGIVHQIILEEQPDKVLVDVGGLGAGVVDRLHELGFRDLVIGVNAGSTPLNAKKYRDKRAEMWGECLSWLQEAPVQITDSDSLHGDLCGVRYSIDSNSRLVMESKKDMKKRGVRSSDEADALCLTFALPQSALENNSRKDDLTATILSSQKSLFDAQRDAYG